MAHELSHVAQQADGAGGARGIRRDPVYPDDTCKNVQDSINAAWHGQAVIQAAPGVCVLTLNRPDQARSQLAVLNGCEAAGFPDCPQNRPQRRLPTVKILNHPDAVRQS